MRRSQDSPVTSLLCWVIYLAKLSVWSMVYEVVTKLPAFSMTNAETWKTNDGANAIKLFLINRTAMISNHAHWSTTITQLSKISFIWQPSFPRSLLRVWGPGVWFHYFIPCQDMSFTLTRCNERFWILPLSQWKWYYSVMTVRPSTPMKYIYCCLRIYPDHRAVRLWLLLQWLNTTNMHVCDVDALVKFWLWLRFTISQAEELI